MFQSSVSVGSTSDWVCSTPALPRNVCSVGRADGKKSRREFCVPLLCLPKFTHVRPLLESRPLPNSGFYSTGPGATPVRPGCAWRSRGQWVWTEGPSVEVFG